MLANYRVPAELSAIETTEDGRAVVIATVDGCLTVLAIADPNKNSFLSALPSRDETVSVNSVLNCNHKHQKFFILVEKENG